MVASGGGSEHMIGVIKALVLDMDGDMECKRASNLR